MSQGLQVVILGGKQAARTSVLLAGLPDVRIAAVGRPDEAAALILRYVPDTILLTEGEDFPSALGVLERLRTLPNSPRPLVITECPDPLPLLAAGAAGVLAVGESAEHVGLAIACAAARHITLSPDYAEMLVTQHLIPTYLYQVNALRRLQLLSTREREVLALVAEGMTNHHIAGQLHISQETVKGHIRLIYSKLGVNNRIHATRILWDSHARHVPPGPPRPASVSG